MNLLASWLRVPPAIQDTAQAASPEVLIGRKVARPGGAWAINDAPNGCWEQLRQRPGGTIAATVRL